MEHGHTPPSTVDGSHGTKKSYMTGFILAVILTVIPFGVVMTSALSPAVTILVVALFAVAQVFVHLVYFLHLSLAPSQTWNVVSLLFSVLVIVFLIGLSVWIMWSMHYHMMIN